MMKCRMMRRDPILHATSFFTCHTITVSCGNVVTRRLLFILLGLFATATALSAGDPLLIDMVHNNPGEKPFVTHYNDPGFLKELG